MATETWFELHAQGLAIVAGVFGAVLSWLQIRRSHPIARHRLKADIEIMRLLDPEGAAYVHVRDHVDAIVEREYRLRRADADVGSEPWRWLVPVSRSDLVGGVMALLVGAGGLVWVLSAAIPDVWAVVPGFFVFVGFGLVVSAYETGPAVTEPARSPPVPNGS